LTAIIGLGTDDDLEFHAFVEHYVLERLQIGRLEKRKENLEIGARYLKSKTYQI
jgi:hypothetical protein